MMSLLCAVIVGVICVLTFTILLPFLCIYCCGAQSVYMGKQVTKSSDYLRDFTARPRVRNTEEDKSDPRMLSSQNLLVRHLEESSMEEPAMTHCKQSLIAARVCKNSGLEKFPKYEHSLREVIVVKYIRAQCLTPVAELQGEEYADTVSIVEANYSTDFDNALNSAKSDSFAAIRYVEF